MTFAASFRLGHAGILLAAAFFFSGHAQPQEIWYDDDTDLTFVWTPAEGSFESYNVYVSVDEGGYQLAGQTPTERFVVNGTNGCTHRVKVAAVSGGFEGPFSPESDPVVCDTVVPLSPTISGTYQVLDEKTVVLKLESAPSDVNFACYQAIGGQFADWTDTAATESFTFTVNAESQNVLAIREKDLAGNAGPEASLTVANLSGDSDSDGIPNYWELMYSPVLNPYDPGDGALDSDGDGYSNYEEYLAGTDPTEANSVPPDTIPPFTYGHSPTKGEKNVPIDTAISLHVADAGTGVYVPNIVMTVNGSQVVPRITGTAADCLVVYEPPVNFAYGETVVVTVDAKDLNSPPNVMAQERYEFTIAGVPIIDPASSDPGVFFYDDFEDGDVQFPKWDATKNSKELATGDLAIVEKTVPGCEGSMVAHLGGAKCSSVGIVKHFAPMDTVYCRWYARFASGLAQQNLLQFVTLAADSTGDLYAIGDVYPNGYDYYRTSLNFSTAIGTHSPPGAALLYTYSLGMSPTFSDTEGSGKKKLNWPGNEFYPTPSLVIQDDRWHCLEMMLRANTPGLADGEQAFWIDGKLAGYWSGMNWRLADTLKVNCLWLRFSLPEVAPNNYVWIDNVALSDKYIGPVHGSWDDTPVAIEGLRVDAVGHTSATITWRTNKPATSIILYGTEEGYGSVTADTTLRTEHLLTLKELETGKDYLCRVVSRDATGSNEASSDGLSFTTLPSAKGIFTEVWGDTAESNHPGTVQDTYIGVVNLMPDCDQESPRTPANSRTLYACTFPTGKPAAALLMKWDLSAIPPTAEILEAKLRLYMCEAAGDADYSMSVHEVVGVNPVISEATGEQYKNGSPWDAFSGLYNDVPLAQGNIAYREDAVNVSDTVGEYKEWTIRKMVSNWVLAPSRNYGLLINPDPNASEGSYRNFRSSSYTDVSQRPQLIVTCRTERGQKLYWENGVLVIWTDPSVSEEYIVQSAISPDAVWTAETGLLSDPLWQSGDLGSTRMRFFRMNAKP